MASSITIDYAHFTPGASTLGGLLIGIFSSIFLIATGRIAGISGLLKSATTIGSKDKANEKNKKSNNDTGLKRAFIAGIVLAGTCAAFTGRDYLPTSDVTAIILGGLLVGAGANLQHGCTS